ncbi:hypothetical protein Acr_13g0016630 [Actinidia rufa]|uniref:Uncharacterized protein n=1 Tax=Actinidia rufa TaxID=165716 RepID=A0A7J0FNV4_9ERIC|nr:hypothetical protein Acr_13g0016630 [Actinidia rufa]
MPSETEEIVIPYFESVFSFDNPDGPSIEVVVAAVSDNLTSDMNNMVVNSFKENKVSASLEENFHPTPPKGGSALFMLTTNPPTFKTGGLVSFFGGFDSTGWANQVKI